MRRIIEEYGKYVEITAYRNVEFDRAETFLKANRKQSQQKVDIQFFDVDLVATQEHLYFAVLNALQAFRTKTNHSNSAAMETMLYASAQRQIQKAIAHIGVKPESKGMGVIVIGAAPEQLDKAIEELTAYLGEEPDESVLGLTKQKQDKIKKAFQITDTELKTVSKENPEKALVALVIEHVALLATQF